MPCRILKLLGIVSLDAAVPHVLFIFPAPHLHPMGPRRVRQRRNRLSVRKAPRQADARRCSCSSNNRGLNVSLSGRIAYGLPADTPSHELAWTTPPQYEAPANILYAARRGLPRFGCTRSRSPSSWSTDTRLPNDGLPFLDSIRYKLSRFSSARRDRFRIPPCASATSRSAIRKTFGF